MTMTPEQLSKLTTCSELGATPPESAIKLLEVIQQRTGTSEAFVSQLLAIFDKIPSFCDLTELVRTFQREYPVINHATESHSENTMFLSMSRQQKLEFNRTLVKISDVIPPKLLEIMICISPINHIEREQVYHGNELFDILKQHSCISANDAELLLEMFALLGLGRANELLQDYLQQYPPLLPSNDPAPSAPFLATPPVLPSNYPPPSAPFLATPPAHTPPSRYTHQPRPTQPSLTPHHRPVEESSPLQGSPSTSTSAQPRHKEPYLPPPSQQATSTPSRSHDAHFRSAQSREPHTHARAWQQQQQQQQQYSPFPPHQSPPKQPASLTFSPSVPVEASSSTRHVVNVSQPQPPSQASHRPPPPPPPPPPPSAPAEQQSSRETSSQSSPEPHSPGCFESCGQHYPSEMAGLGCQKRSDDERVEERCEEPALSLRPPPVNHYLDLPPVPPTTTDPSEAATTISTENTLLSSESKARFPAAQPRRNTPNNPSEPASTISTESSLPSFESKVRFPAAQPRGNTPNNPSEPASTISTESSLLSFESKARFPAAKPSTISVAEVLKRQGRSTRSTRRISHRAAREGSPGSSGGASSLKRTRRETEEQFVTAVQEGGLVRKKLKAEKKVPKQKKSLVNQAVSKVFGMIGLGRQQNTDTSSSEDTYIAM